MAGSASEPDTWRLTDEQIAELVNLLISLTPQGRAAKIATAIIGRLGRVGKIIINRAEQGKPPLPPKKPASTTPKLDDTSTWPKPPRPGKYKEGIPSRSKPKSRGEKSLYDEVGGEWRYNNGDKYHNPHWDYKPAGKAQQWQNISINGKPPIK